MNHPRIAIIAASCAITVLCPSVGNAQQAEGWKWQATAYVYLPDIGGSTTFPESGSGSGLTLDSSTILDNLKMTFMGSIEARNAQGAGQVDELWILDVAGRIVILDAAYGPAVPAQLVDEMRALAASATFEVP